MIEGEVFLFLLAIVFIGPIVLFAVLSIGASLLSVILAPFIVLFTRRK